MTDEVRQALNVCPKEVVQAVEAYPKHGALEELRFRSGGVLQLYAGGKEQAAPQVRITGELLQEILSAATEQSLYAVQNTLRQGFLTIPGGHRLGLCGAGVIKDGAVSSLRELSSMNLRIARQIAGCGDKAADWLWTHPRSTLLIGPPARGKTTLLRDLICQISDRFCWRVCVVDERFELACCVDGRPQFRVGAHTDVLSGISKACGIEMLLRTMNPQWIALDEITAHEDVEAVVRASYCGVRFLATAHASSREELCRRPVYRALLEAQAFDNLITILPNRDLQMERM